MDRTKTLIIAGGILIILLAVSGLHPYDRLTWGLEVFPIIVLLPILVLTYKRFPLTTLLYTLIFIHSIILMVGGHYTYARVPLGFAMAKLLAVHRNPYDKIGHFAQGLVPALAARELLIRGRYVRTSGMLAFIVASIALAISAAYELFEWASAVALGQGADDFLGTQGDPWDTQSDMLFALIGGIIAVTLFSRVQDRQISALQASGADA